MRASKRHSEHSRRITRGKSKHRSVYTQALSGLLCISLTVLMDVESPREARVKVMGEGEREKSERRILTNGCHRASKVVALLAIETFVLFTFTCSLENALR